MIEDALVKVDKFIFPADFVVLDMHIIDVQSGGLTLRVNGEKVKPNDEKVTCHRVYSIGSHVVDTQLGLNPEVSWEV